MVFRHSTQLLRNRWVVADQTDLVSSYTQKNFFFWIYTSSSDIKRVWEGGYLLEEGLEVGLGAVAVVRLSVGGLLL